MKRIVVLILAITVLTSLRAQQSETRSISTFKSVKAQDAIDVYLKKGDKEAVKVETSGEFSDIVTEVTGNTLRIHRKEGYLFKRGNGKSAKVYVTYVNIERISASSASNVFSESTIKASSMDISVSSAASVEINIETEIATIDVSSAGNMVIEGKAKKLEVEASSAGDVDAYKLESETVSCHVSSGGSAKISVIKQLEARASSGGSIRYRGNPTNTNTHASSGGSVKKSF